MRRCYTKTEGPQEDGIIKYIPLDRIPMRAYPPKYSPKLGVSVVRPKAAPPGLRGERCCFTVQCGEVSHVLAADSPELAQRWIDKLNKAWLHYTEAGSRRLVATTSSERHAHERENLRGEIERFRYEAQETRVEAAKREDVLRQEVHQATERARRMESMVKDRTTYTVWVHTGNIKGSGTSAKVTISLLGSHERSSGDMPLEAKGERRHTAFDRGAVSKFTVECGYVGELHSIIIGHDGSGYSPSWYVNKVKVKCDRDNSTWQFPVGKWFDINAHDGATYREVPAGAPALSDKDARGSNVYFVTVYTSDLRGAGTDANVSMVIHGTRGDTGPLRLAKGRDDFVRGARDQFVVEGPDVGEIRTLVIGHDDSGAGASWHLEQVEIRSEKQKNKLVMFPCNEWFDSDHGDGLISRTLTPEDPLNPVARTMVRHLITVFTSDIPAAATDAGVSITLNGERGTSGPHELTCGRNDFTRGAKDIFPLDIKDVGPVTSVVISQDGRGLSPSWHLDQVVVLNKHTGAEYAFVCEGWVEAAGGSEKGASILLEAKSAEIMTRTAKDTYSVQVMTSDIRGAATDANVFLEMFGADGKSSGKRRLINDSKSCFERGALDLFTLRSRDLGPIDRVVISRDRAGKGQGWHLKEIIVQNQDKAGGPIKFLANRWLEGSLLEVELFPEGSSRATVHLKYHVTVNTSNQKGAGTHSNVSIKLTGKKGAFGPVPLEGGGRSAFDRGKQDSFLIECPDLGEITGVNIGHDGSGGGFLSGPSKWLLDSVLVQAMKMDASNNLIPTGGIVTFPCGQWLKKSGTSSKKLIGGTDNPGLRVDLVPAGATGAPALITTYTVVVQTSDLKGAGTDANVYVVLHGADGKKTDKLELHAASHDDFERAQRDTFTLQVPDVGEVERIEIGHDGTSVKPAWHLDHVEVTREDEKADATAAAAAKAARTKAADPTGQATASPPSPSPTPRSAEAAAAIAAAASKEEARDKAAARAARTAFFPANRWLAQGMGDGQLKVELMRGTPPAHHASIRAGEPPQLYKVVVHTSDLPGAGTDASVYLQLHGELGDSMPCPLVAEPGKMSEMFERGSKDTFELRLQAVGKLTAVTVGHDCRGRSPDWHVDTIEVTDVAAVSKAAAEAAATGVEGVSAAAAAATSYFYVGAWIETEGRPAGKRTSVRVKASSSGENPRGARATYNVAVKTADVRGAGTDSPVYIDIHGMLEGKKISTGPTPLRNNSRNLFNRGASDEFSVTGPDMEYITHISLGHSSATTGHGWRPTRAEVRGARATHHAVFSIGSDIPVEGKGLVMVDFQPDTASGQPKAGPAADGTVAAPALQAAKSGRYKVTVKTSNARGADTDADVFILIGGPGNVVTGPHPLEALKGQLFQRGHTDTFEIEAPVVGDAIQTIELSHNSRGRSPAWCVECVNVEELTTGISALFAAKDQWLLPSEKGSGTMVTMKLTNPLPHSLEIYAPTTYRIAVHTSDFRGAGTDANVYVVLHGEQGDTQRVPLEISPVAAGWLAAGDTRYDPFERGSEDVFVIDAPGSLGRVTGLTVGHDGRAGNVGSMKDTWHLDYIEMVELPSETAAEAKERFRRGEIPPIPARSVSSPLYFTCKQWLGWIAEDKLLERRLAASIASPAQAKADYTVVVHTRDKRGAGTDASVRVAMRGALGTTGYVTLTQSAYDLGTKMKIGNQGSNAANHNFFARASVDAFVLKNVTDVGDVEHLTLGHDGLGHDTSWAPHAVQVRRLGGSDSKPGPTVNFKCPVSCHIETSADVVELLPAPHHEALDDPEHTYAVKVTTADEQGAGTDADVYVILRGTAGELPRRILHKTLTGSNPFQRGATDVFAIKGVGVGEITEIEVGHDNRGHNPGWKMVSIAITDESPGGEGSTRYFNCNEWFDREIGDSLISRVIPASTMPPSPPQDLYGKSTVEPELLPAAADSSGGLGSLVASDIAPAARQPSSSPGASGLDPAALQTSSPRPQPSRLTPLAPLTAGGSVGSTSGGLAPLTGAGSVGLGALTREGSISPRGGLQ